MKNLIYRFAVWLEYRALDLQDRFQPDVWQKMSLEDVVVGGINHDPSPIWQNNALLKRLADHD